MFQFITKRSFIQNLVVAILLVLFLVLIFLELLDWITLHNQSKQVPSVKGLTYENAEKTLDNAGFNAEVQDSIYIDTFPALAVVKQTPDVGETVKSGRTIYLTLNRSVAPEIEMPNLVGQPFRSAQMQLNASGLKLGDTSYKPDFARNSVLEQTFKGKKINPGEKIPMGSVISLVLGSGIQQIEMPVPNLIGVPFGEAKAFLESKGIVIGAVIPDPDVSDNESAYIYKQNPARYDELRNLMRIRSGQMMDLWLSKEKPESKRDSTQNDPPDEPKYDY